MFCLYCQKIHKAWFPWCWSCWHELQTTTEHSFVWDYKTPEVRRFIKNLKQGNSWRLQQLAFRQLRKQLLQQPLSSTHLWVTNLATQAQAPLALSNDALAPLARELAGLINAAWQPNLLAKKQRRRQALRRGRERWDGGLFWKINDIYLPKIQNERPEILLLDDVETTGISLFQAELLLLEAGARKIHKLTLAKSYLLNPYERKATQLPQKRPKDLASDETPLYASLVRDH